MNTSRISPFIFLATVAATLIACNPCETGSRIATGITIDDLTDICWITTADGDDTSGSSGSSSDTDVDATGGQVCNVAIGCDPGEECVSGFCVPQSSCPDDAGALWGRCDVTGGCLPGATCLFGDAGWICAPDCGDNNACEVAICDLDAGFPICLLDDQLCAHECAGDADCDAGQVCALVDGSSSTVCMWSK